MPALATGVVSIATGNYHALALRADGRVVAWSYDGNRLGEATVPPGLADIVGVAAGGFTSLALRSDGTVVGWGGNYNGQANSPPGLSNVVALAVGATHSVALRRDGTVVVWGQNSYTPAGLSNVVAISANIDLGTIALVGDAPPLLHCALNNPAWKGQRFSVSLQTESGHTYRLESKASWNDTHWTALPLVSGIACPVTLTDPAAAAQQRFYRARRW